MAGKDIIIMNMKELRRIPVIHSVINKHTTQKEAAVILGLSRVKSSLKKIRYKLILRH